MGGEGTRRGPDQAQASGFDDLDYARVVDELVEAGHGPPGHIFRTLTQRQFTYYVDAARFRHHTERGFAYVLAGGDAGEFPDYESAVEAHRLTPEEIEARLSASPWVTRVVEPPAE